MEDATTGLRLHPEAMAVQGVVLVVVDVNKDICMQALNWALGHVARKGDAIRLVGVLSHVLNPSKSQWRSPLNCRWREWKDPSLLVAFVVL